MSMKRPKVNAIARLEFERAYYDVAIHQISHYPPPPDIIMYFLLSNFTAMKVCSQKYEYIVVHKSIKKVLLFLVTEVIIIFFISFNVVEFGKNITPNNNHFDCVIFNLHNKILLSLI